MNKYFRWPLRIKQTQYGGRNSTQIAVVNNNGINLNNLSVGDLIDTLISHNEVIELYYSKPNDHDHNYSLWRGMGHQIPEKYLKLRVIKIFGVIPESIVNADTINILVKYNGMGGK